MLDLAVFPMVLAETIEWCKDRASPSEPSDSLRSAELRPPVDSLFGLREATIQAVVEKRRSLIHGRGLLRAYDLAGGRILLYEPENNLFDGAAMVASRDFFDVDNVPPWDTWLGYIHGTWEHTTTHAKFTHLYLLSWVPPAFLALAGDGVWANPEQCIRWAVDVEHDFLRQLQSVGLLA